MDESPRKFFITNLINKPSPACVWLQGTVEQTVKNDIIILNDGTGRAKITKCESADGLIDKSSLSKGAYFCIIGTLINSKGLPEIQANKILNLSANESLQMSWTTEVKEANLFFEGKICPSIE